jgi:xylulokinase
MKYFLGIDSGTSGVKAIVVGEDGHSAGVGYEEIDVITEKPMWAEQNPVDWWTACKKAVKQAVHNSGVGDEISGIGVTGQMLGSTLLDKNNDPVSKCIIWLDQRAVDEVDWIVETAGMETLLERTSNIPLTGYWAPKLMWIKKNQPEIFDQVAQVVFPKDFIKLKLTGEISLEVTDCSGSYLFDVPKRKWSDEMFELCGLPREIVSDNVIESQEIAGYLRKDVAEELGLTAGIPVVGGAGDQPACGLGSGVYREGIVSATIGTSGVVYAAANKPIPDVNRAAALSFCHSVPDTWCLFGCTLAAGGSFKWLRDTVFTDQRDRMKQEGKDVYSLMTDLASKAQIGSEGLVFLPYLNGERTPYPDPYAKGVFFGLSYRHGLNELSRSVMEGVTFSLRDTIELLRDANVSVSEVRASGGGAKSALWLQMQADIYDASIVTTNISETGCVGAAMMAAIGSGHFKDAEEACSQIIKPISVTVPDKNNVKIYEDFYQTYRSLYGTLKDTFAIQAMYVEKWG